MLWSFGGQAPVGGCTSVLQLPLAGSPESPPKPSRAQASLQNRPLEAPSKLPIPHFLFPQGCALPGQEPPKAVQPRDGLTGFPPGPSQSHGKNQGGSWELGGGRGDGRGGGNVQGRQLGAQARSWGLRLSDLGSKARSRVWGAEPRGAGMGSKGGCLTYTQKGNRTNSRSS